MRKVLVIGAAGHVGRIVRPALEAAYETRYLDRVPIDDAPDRSFVGDLEDEALVERCVEGIDCVIYLAMGVNDEGRNNAIDPAFNVNVRGVYRVGSIALAAGVQTFVYASSISVFQAPRTHVIDETTPPTTHGLYGLTKYLGEQVLAALSRAHPGATLLALRLYRPLSEQQWASEDNQDRFEPKSLLGPADTARLFVAGAALTTPGYHLAQATGDVEGKRYPADRVRELLGWTPQGR